jgi:hypothetical protein
MYNESLRAFGILPEDEKNIAKDHITQVGGGHVIVIGTDDGVKIVADPLGREVPAEIRAAGFHEPVRESSKWFFRDGVVKAKYDGSGNVVSPGYIPSGKWVGGGSPSGPGPDAQSSTAALVNLIGAAVSYAQATS